VIEEHRVDRLAHRVVAAEAERHVGDAAGHQRAGEVLLDPAGGLDEVDPVGRVLLDAGRHGEDVGVEDDVFGREADLVDEDPVGRAADLASARQVVGLALLVEGHDDDGGAVFAAERACSTNASPSFMEMELTIGLPWMVLRPASMTSHLDESTMTGPGRCRARWR
jgi:hypothetical protein